MFIIKDKAYDAKETVKDKARDTKEFVKDKAYDAKVSLLTYACNHYSRGDCVFVAKTCFLL